METIQAEGAEEATNSGQVHIGVDKTIQAKDDTKPDMETVTKQSDYATQYFGFTPESFTDGLYNAMVEYLYEDIKALEEYIKQEFSNVMTEEEVREAVNKILPIFTGSFNKAFDKLEAYLLTNILRVPNNVLLPEDKLQDVQVTEAQEAQIDLEIANLKQQILNAKYVGEKLEQQISDVRHTQQALNQTLQWFNNIDKICQQNGVSALGEAIKFAHERNNSLQHKLQQLQANNT